MKILHTSDWHLGAKDNERSLYDDQKFFIDEICRIVAEKSVRAVLLAGDVYDTAVSSAEAIRLYDYAMTRLCGELGVRVITIAGNHDSAERLASCRELLSPAGLYVCGMAEREPAKVSLEDTDFYLLPWITEEKVKSLFPEEKNNIHSLEDAYRVVTGRIRQGLDPARRSVVLAHAYITDAETSTSDRAAEIGFAPQVPADVFEGFDYTALGHIHKPQDVAPQVRYCGTPMPYSFGKEETQQKSVTILDTADLSREIVPLPLLHVRATLTGTLEELLTTPDDETVRNGYVRLQITDQYVGLASITELRRIYPNALEISGKSFENENSTVTLTIEELEKLETSPVEVFRYFCREETGEEADERLLRLFENAVQAAEEAAE